jgi:hypothetical protein
LADYFVPRGSRLPTLTATFTNDDGTAVDLTTATGVTFTMVGVDGTTKINAASCTVTDADSGIVEYSWTAADIDTSGDYFGKFTATFPGSLPAVVPTDRELWIVVHG